MVALGCLLLLTAVLCFGPRAWLRHSSYRQAELAEQREQLLRTRQQLLVKHAQLTEVDRVTDMAAAQGFGKPELENYIWQKPNATDDAALARAFFRRASKVSADASARTPSGAPRRSRR